MFVVKIVSFLQTLLLLWNSLQCKFSAVFLEP